MYPSIPAAHTYSLHTYCPQSSTIYLVQYGHPEAMGQRQVNRLNKGEPRGRKKLKLCRHQRPGLRHLGKASVGVWPCSLPVPLYVPEQSNYTENSGPTKPLILYRRHLLTLVAEDNFLSCISHLLRPPTAWEVSQTYPVT